MSKKVLFIRYEPADEGALLERKVLEFSDSDHANIAILSTRAVSVNQAGTGKQIIAIPVID